MDELTRFAQRLVEQLGQSGDGVHRAVAVSELRETVLPYRKHRKALGVESVEDYESILLRLVGGERGYVRTMPAEAAERCRKELAHPNPDLGLLDELGTVTVQITSMAAAQIVGDDPGAPAVENTPKAAAVKPVMPEPAPPPAAAAPAPNPPEPPPVVPKLRPLREAKPASAPPIPEPVMPSPAAPLPAEKVSEVSGTCTHQVPAGRQAVFCPWCGERLIPFTCARCNTELDSEWRHCITCGAPVKDPYRFS